MESLATFLASKPLYYDKIDLERMPAAYAEVAAYLKPGRVIHVVGTNGKGSTGRMLARMLTHHGRVGHYTSPHILRFNERVWIDGTEASDVTLERAHRRLRAWLNPRTAEALSYFEYTTLLALTAFEGCDYIVLEAGLGGEFDATNVVPKTLSLITPIGPDHQAFLGESLEAIAATKLRSVTSEAIVSSSQPPEVWRVARQLSGERGVTFYRADKILSAEGSAAVDAMAERLAWPPFMRENGVTAAAAYEHLMHTPVTKKLLSPPDLRGRFERLAPNVVLDVGHNEPAAEALAGALAPERRILVYNALDDKDVAAVLRRLRPVVERLEILPIDSPRTMAPSRLRAAAEDLGIETGDFEGIDPAKRYLVFGSFYVAEAFLRRWRRGA